MKPTNAHARRSREPQHQAKKFTCPLKVHLESRFHECSPGRTEPSAGPPPEEVFISLALSVADDYRSAFRIGQFLDGSGRRTVLGHGVARILTSFSVDSLAFLFGSPRRTSGRMRRASATPPFHKTANAGRELTRGSPFFADRSLSCIVRGVFVPGPRASDVARRPVLARG